MTDTRAIKPEDDKGGTFTQQLTVAEVTTAYVSPVPSEAPGVITAEPGTVNEEAIHFKTKDAGAGTISGLTRDYTNLNGGTGIQHENSEDWEIFQNAFYVKNLVDILTEGYLREQQTVARTAATTFTVVGNVAALYTTDRIMRFNGDNTEVETVVSSSYSAGTGLTTVTVTGSIPNPLTYVEIGIQPKAAAFLQTSKVIDDDTMATALPTNVPSAESMKFYVDNYGNNSSMFRQALINGEMDIAQAGATFTAPADGVTTLDGYVTGFVTDGVVDVKQTADAPTIVESGLYSPYCLHLDVTTADATIAAGQIYVISQRVEGYRVAGYGFGQTGTRYATLSFWAKHTKTGIYCVAFRNGASNRSYVAEYTILASNTWERKVITIPIDTTGTWLYTTGIGLKIDWCVAAGSTFQTTANTWTAGSYFATSNQVNGLDNASNDFKIARAKLQFGIGDFPIQPMGFEKNLLECMRYFEKSYNYTSPAGTVESSGRLVMPLQTVAANSTYRLSTLFKVPKRTASPTVAFYNPITGTVNKVHCYDGGDREVNCTATEVGQSGAYAAITTPNNAGAATVFISAHYTASDRL